MKGKETSIEEPSSKMRVDSHPKKGILAFEGWVVTIFVIGSDRRECGDLILFKILLDFYFEGE